MKHVITVLSFVLFFGGIYGIACTLLERHPLWPLAQRSLSFQEVAVIGIVSFIGIIVGMWLGEKA